MNYFHKYVYFIIIIKVLFILLTILHLYMKAKGSIDSDLYKKIVYWKERIEFIFQILMSILLIYLFNPIYDHTFLVDKQVKILLYVFGFVLLITAKWGTFFKESVWFRYLQKTLG